MATEQKDQQRPATYERTIGATGGWKVGVDANEPLPEFIQDYTRDILTWFNPTQGWQITEVRAGLLDPAQIRAAVEQRTDVPTELSPDLLTLGFSLRAAAPPLKRNWRRSPVGLDMGKSFFSRF